MKYLIPMLFCLVISLSVSAECPSKVNSDQYRINILELLDVYAKRTGTKFAVDPRVKGKATLIGLQLDEIEQTDLTQILSMLSFVAYEKNNIVYIYPTTVEKILGEDVEAHWGIKWQQSPEQ